MTTNAQLINQGAPLLRVSGLKRYFDVSRPLLNRLLEGKPRMILKAVSGIDFELYRGETFALVGESGCGKSTVANLVVRLHRPTAGKIEFDGIDVGSITNRTQMAQLRRRMAMIFQDPYASLNPRWRVAAIVSEPIRAFGLLKGSGKISQRTGELLTQVGLSPADGEKYPHEFSGGQRQRISIARALVSGPKFIVADESVAALDVSIQADVLNLLNKIQRDSGITFLFISHDLSVIAHTCDFVAVMYLGQIVESAPTRKLFSETSHPYTKALLSAIPSLDPDVRGNAQKLEGEIPSPINPPPGCRFNTRCPHAQERCRSEVPEWREMSSGHHVACHFSEELA